jgi:hypothetical protein
MSAKKLNIVPINHLSVCCLIFNVRPFWLRKNISIKNTEIKAVAAPK